MTLLSLTFRLIPQVCYWLLSRNCLIKETICLAVVHYRTDSQTSQYRNGYIVNSILNHEDMYGCHASWNYYGSRYGQMYFTNSGLRLSVRLTKLFALENVR